MGISSIPSGFWVGTALFIHLFIQDFIQPAFTGMHSTLGAGLRRWLESWSDAVLALGELTGSSKERKSIIDETGVIGHFGHAERE